MHWSWHCPTHRIRLMFAHVVFKFQKLEKLFESFKIYHWMALLEQLLDCHNLHIFILFGLSFTIWAKFMSNPIVAYNFSFLTCALVEFKKYAAIITSRWIVMHFFNHACLIKKSNFGTNKFSLPSILEQTLHLIILILPPTPQNNLG